MGKASISYTMYYAEDTTINSVEIKAQVEIKAEYSFSKDF